MHIVLNAQLLSLKTSYRSAGVSNYSRNLIRALGRLVTTGETAARVTAFVADAEFHAPGVALASSHLPFNIPLARIGWEQAAQPILLRQLGADVQHGLVNVLPLASSVPGVVTVHDLSFVRLPDKFPAAKRFYLARLCRAAAHKAVHVIAVSRQTADDLIRYFDVPAHKIQVIHNGVEARFSPGAEANVTAFRKTRGLPDRFLLYLGTLEPRKNLNLLLGAFARFRKEPEHADIKLVMAGGKGWFFEEIFRRVETLGLQDAVLLPGFVPDAELPDWYRAALAFVYPSLFEGFGLPVLEAMACGTPVVCSRVGSLLEIAGDAAITVPATDGDGWVAALTLATGQADLRAELQRRGPVRAARFSWQAAARATLQVYTDIASGRS